MLLHTPCVSCHVSSYVQKAPTCRPPRAAPQVVEVAPDEARGGFKIGCSIKLVNQASGEDLDPTNMRWAAGWGTGLGAKESVSG